MILLSGYSTSKVIKSLLLVTAFLGLSFQTGDKDFKSSQTKYKRVKTAYEKKWDGLKKALAD
ncbi:MAG TPA: hypothetical protein PLU73_05525, partial [Bacteroidia bacterium]|nr:hypothetical protein [Bacteroidia bacterium]